MASKKKNPAAVALGKERWKGLSEEEVREHQSAAASARWEDATEEERAAIGKRLAEARAKARGKKAGKK